jgi:recombinational DNA repair protein (RecF pathway)
MNVFIAFIIQFIHRLGASLTLDHCVRCDAPVDGATKNARFQLSEGTVVCASCAETSSLSGMPLSPGALQSMRYFIRTMIAQSTELTLALSVRAEVLSVLQAFMLYHIPGMRPLRSLSLFYDHAHITYTT